MTQQAEEANQDAGTQPRKEARNPAAGMVEKPAENAVVTPVPEENPTVAVVEQTPKKPFWKFWQK